MAAALGDRVVLNSPVGRIVQNRSDIVVHSAKRTVTAKQVIVAIPPTLTARIQCRGRGSVRALIAQLFDGQRRLTAAPYAGARERGGTCELSLS